MFQEDNIIVDIIDIFLIDRVKNNFPTAKRPFHVFSKRLEGQTCIYYGAETFEVTNDKMLYIPADIEYRQESYGTEKLIAIHANILNFDTKEIYLIDLPNGQADDTFCRLYEIWSQKESGYRYNAASIFYNLLGKVEFPPVHSDKNSCLIDSSVQYINSNFASKLTIGMLAEMSGMSESYYRRIFNNNFGVSPLIYINKKRIAAAKSMILSGYYTMAAIAEKCGFVEQKYFNAVFKRETGKSPAQYRRETLNPK